MPSATTRVCSLCEAMCGLSVEWKGGPLPTLRGDAEDVFSHGAFCPKSQGLLDIYSDPDRLKRPLKRVGETFVEVSWQEAFDDIAQRTQALQKTYGRSTIATYLGNPNSHHAGNLLMLPLFLKALRSRNLFSATSVDQLPHMLVAYLMYGHQLLLPIADVDHTEYMLIFGANPVVSNGSLLSGAGLSTRIKAIAKRGKVVVIDPRYTETSSMATEHHFIRPGTDAYLLAALVRRLLATPRLRHLEEHVEGLDALRELFGSGHFSDERASALTGVPVATIEAIGTDLLTRDRAICYGRLGVSTQQFGAACQWFISLINILTGNLDRPGGVLFTKPAIDVVGLMAKFGSRGSFARRKSRVRGLPEFGGEFPATILGEEILTPGEGQVRGLFTVAGNPVLSLPNGKKLETALAQLELYVAVDFYQNETTRHAHYILPPTTALEHDHYDLVFNAFATRNVARFSPALLDPPADSFEDWQILLQLWARLVPPGKRLERLTRKAMAALLEKRGLNYFLDVSLRLGPYKKERLSLKKLRETPHGVDLGALQPSLPGRLFTKSKKIQLCPQPMREAWTLLVEASSEATQRLAEGELMVIGRRNLKSNNSWMHNCESLNKGRNQCFVQMHRRDAELRQLQEGMEVEVKTAIGAIVLPLQVNERIMPGVVCIPHGWGHHRVGTKQRVAEAHPGVSLNDVLDDAQVDRFSGNAVLNGQWVKVEKVPPLRGPPGGLAMLGAHTGAD